MKDMTSGFHGNLADISTGSEITPLQYIWRKQKKQDGTKKSTCVFSVSQLVLNQDPDFTLDIK